MTSIRHLKVLASHASATIALLLLLCASPALAQGSSALYQPDPDSPIGERNRNGPPELAMYDFLIGDWDADVKFTKANGDEVSYKAKWHNIWIGNGYVVMQEWRGTYTTGSEFRSYDPRQKKWLGQNIYFNKGWKATEIEFRDDKMIVYNAHAEDQNGPFMARETYYDIKENSFKIRSDRSDDGGKTWQPGAYVIEATRAGTVPHADTRPDR